MKLKCPNCEFEFSIEWTGEISAEDKEEIMTCPCGCRMDEVVE